METERTITERRAYWESLARKTSRVHRKSDECQRKGVKLWQTETPSSGA